MAVEAVELLLLLVVGLVELDLKLKVLKVETIWLSVHRGLALVAVDLVSKVALLVKMELIDLVALVEKDHFLELAGHLLSTLVAVVVVVETLLVVLVEELLVVWVALAVAVVAVTKI